MDNRQFEQEQLIAGCKRKEALARKKLYERYAPAMLGLCIRYVKERETAQDILQEGFIKIFTKIGEYSGTGSFEAWMKKVFVTTALEYLRQTKVWRSNVSLEDYNENMIDHFDISMAAKLSADEILRHVNELPDGFRTVFNLYAIEGYSHAEIADMLGIKEASSRSQLARARSLLQTKIQNMY
ncbi:MAG: sigma-70 family RNA polymerase sigma factor [Dysgonamonadaceae bacterium]|jgi:RNA polymerase sigma-70 factor (ECF subfamily)|nr:sigma-70 family RNA polymerase sigma factor [Dysgonamonadaceae bacterium]